MNPTKLLYLVLFSTACTAATSSPMPGGGGGGAAAPDAAGSQQHVVECSGVIYSGQASYCPHDDCDETATPKVSCAAYASVTLDATDGACRAGETGSYGLVFADAPNDVASTVYEVVHCDAGAATVQLCPSGFDDNETDAAGNPAYGCR